MIVPVPRSPFHVPRSRSRSRAPATFMKTLSRPRDKAEVLRRLRALRPDSARQWGRMSRAPDGLSPVGRVPDGHGSKTRQPRLGFARADDLQVDRALHAVALAGRNPDASGGRSGIRRHEADGVRRGRGPLEALVEIVTTRPSFFAGRRHPIFGSLSDAAWMRWGYLHMDHHLGSLASRTVTEAVRGCVGSEVRRRQE